MRVVLVCGMAQQGKTTRSLWLAQHRARRILILDPARSRPFTGVGTAYTSWTAVATSLAQDNGPWIKVLRSQDFTDYERALRAAPYLRHVTLLVDEALTFTSDVAALDALIPCVRMNAHFGNGLGVPVILTAQRPLDLPPDVRSQVTELHSFRQREPRDLQWISAFASPEFAAQVAELAPHQAVVFPPSTEAVKEGSEHASGQGNPVGSGRSIDRAGGVSDVPEAEPDPEAARRGQVTGEQPTEKGDGFTWHSRRTSIREA